jgi:glucosyl-3-phosphoglycerate synthase
MDGVGLVDEVVVLDHASTDRTAQVARDSGALVVDADAVMSGFGPAVGKGDVLWRALAATEADIVMYCDADLKVFDPARYVSLAGPLLADDSVHLVHATGDRVLHGRSGEGGRTTMLAARPILSLLFPEASHLTQPLGGEYAGRRSTLLEMPFEVDYGVEIGLIIDIARAHGPAAVAEVETGPRAHGSQPLTALSAQARQVLRTALMRAGVAVAGPVPEARPPMRQALAGQVSARS